MRTRRRAIRGWSHSLRREKAFPRLRFLQARRGTHPHRSLRENRNVSHGAQAMSDFQTHTVENQPPEFAPRDLWADDVALREALAREGGEAHVERGARYGLLAGGELRSAEPTSELPYHRRNSYPV